MSNLGTPIRSILPQLYCVFATDNSVRQYTFGGGGGNRTHVHNNVQTTSTNYFNIKSIVTTPTANAQAPM